MRLELIHPMIVHFPIALLLTGTILRFVAFYISKRAAFSFLLPASWTILLLGVISAWVAVFAGEIAADIVGGALENPQILSEHAMHALITATGFTLSLIIDWARAFLLTKLHKRSWFIKKGLAAIVGLFYLFSLTNLVITGEYGATLVYEEGAAVKKTNH
ncbi:MAG: hypothetical protein HKM07_06925 [Chlamydiae bacterium]|nr:hypothetical protein [Chlamydiota bacterium]